MTLMKVTSSSFHFGFHDEPALQQDSAIFPFPSEAKHWNFHALARKDHDRLNLPIQIEFSRMFD